MKRLVLFNGGLKSTFLAALAAREGEVILCRFTLKSEGRCDYLKEARLAGMFASSCIEKDLTGAPLYDEILLRMLYFVLHALPIAKAEQCKCIYHGLSQDDDPRIVPIMDAYVKQLGALIELSQPLYDGKGIWLGQVEIETPLRRLDRARVIRLGNEWNIPWELTRSCRYSNSRVHCGSCPSCLRRKAAFKKEGHEDPTIYAVEDFEAV